MSNRTYSSVGTQWEVARTVEPISADSMDIFGPAENTVGTVKEPVETVSPKEVKPSIFIVQEKTETDPAAVGKVSFWKRIPTWVYVTVGVVSVAGICYWLFNPNGPIFKKA